MSSKSAPPHQSFHCASGRCRTSSNDKHAMLWHWQLHHKVTAEVAASILPLCTLDGNAELKEMLASRQAMDARAVIGQRVCRPEDGTILIDRPYKIAIPMSKQSALAPQTRPSRRQQLMPTVRDLLPKYNRRSSTASSTTVRQLVMQRNIGGNMPVTVHRIAPPPPPPTIVPTRNPATSSGRLNIVYKTDYSATPKTVVQRKPGRREIFCPSCRVRFGNAEQLATHGDRCQASASGTFRCPNYKCRKVYTSEFWLKRHVALDHGGVATAGQSTATTATNALRGKEGE